MKENALAAHDITAGQEWRAHWPTVFAGTAGMSLTTLYVYSSGALVQPIELDTGWSRTQINSGLSVVTVVATVLGPIVGLAVDRYGSRALAVPGIVMFCGSLALVSLANSIWTWWLLWALVGFGSMGVKPSVWTAAAAGLFAKGRGLALALVLCGTGIGSSLAPLLATALVESFGWRMTYVLMPLIWGAVCLPFVFLMFRGPMDKGAERPAPRAEGTSLRSLAGIFRSRNFILLTLGSMLFILVVMGLVVSMIPMLTTSGISRGVAAMISATVGVTSITGRILTGITIDRGNPRLIAATCFGLPVITVLLLLFMPGSAQAATVAVAVLGMALGGQMNAVAYLTSYHFGIRQYGALFGTIASGLTLVSGLGPLAAGISFDLTGGYGLALSMSVPFIVASVLCILGLRREAVGGQAAYAT